VSDYFGALMRASGLAPATTAPAADLPREVEAPEPAAQEEPAPAAAVQPRRGEAAPIGQVEAQPPATPVTPVRTGDPVHSVTPPAAPASRTRAAAPGPAPRPAPAAAPALRPDPGHGVDLVQAALRWIAADPGQAEAARALPDPVRAAAPPAGVPPARPVASRSQPAARLVETPAARRTERAAPAAGAPLDVTIGAIHLRVDPPAPQTVAQAAPPAPPAAPSTPRSALSRRSLRRI
jgi:hypothetical protein